MGKECRKELGLDGDDDEEKKSGKSGRKTKRRKEEKRLEASSSEEEERRREKKKQKKVKNLILKYKTIRREITSRNENGKISLIFFLVLGFYGK
jgi:hypothetical protein